MALATTEGVEAALARELSEAEEARAETLIEEASDLVVGYLGCDPSDTSTNPATVPDAVSRVVARMVARVMSQSGPVGSEGTTATVGPFSQTVRFGTGTTAGNPWLAAADKITLRPYRCGGGMQSVPLSSVQTGRYRRYP